MKKSDNKLPPQPIFFRGVEQEKEDTRHWLRVMWDQSKRDLEDPHTLFLFVFSGIAVAIMFYCLLGW